MRVLGTVALVTATIVPSASVVVVASRPVVVAALVAAPLVIIIVVLLPAVIVALVVGWPATLGPLLRVPSLEILSVTFIFWVLLLMRWVVTLRAMEICGTGAATVLW